MGVKQPHFVDWLMTKFPGAFRPVTVHERAFFDTVYIDVNPLIHDTLRSSKTEKMFVKRFFDMIDKILTQCTPTRICYLAVDGPGPLAKLLEQRKRREKNKKKSNGLSTLQITPGCLFMERVEIYLAYYICRYLQTKKHPQDLKFVIDGAASPGEGESKIIQNLSENSALIEGSCAIVTPDSDAILQAIASGIPRLFVVRKIKQAQHKVLSIDSLTLQLNTWFPGQGARMRLDFVVLAMMCGNDYLGKLRHSSMDRLWLHYLGLKTGRSRRFGARFKDLFLVDAEGRTIDLRMLKALMAELPHYWRSDERWTSAPETSAPGTSAPGTSAPGTSASGASISVGEVDLAFEVDMEVEEADVEEADDVVVWKGLMALKKQVDVVTEDEVVGDLDEDIMDDDDIEMEEDEMEEEELEDVTVSYTFNAESSSPMFDVRTYLEGLLWNLTMYAEGRCPDFKYTYRYRMAPSPRQILEWVNEREKAAGTLVGQLITCPQSSQLPFSPLLCALLVLPERGNIYLHSSFSTLLTTHAALITAIVASQGSDGGALATLSAAISAIHSTLSPTDRLLLTPLFEFRNPSVWWQSLLREHDIPMPIPPSEAGDWPALARGSNIKFKDVVKTVPQDATAMGWIDAERLRVEAIQAGAWPFRKIFGGGTHRIDGGYQGRGQGRGRGYRGARRGESSRPSRGYQGSRRALGHNVQSAN
ncbi:XRN 5'-3' exonuclease N-terminus-domain-containing protein [Jimgerdemannia flammicorona]|uniref:XRN 5'-3' exonuclease N-terminus-domain-containing protein n=1 Tax=Jimgerdemannia flammicorona TaxID=994334 RepID=A0A433QGS0_9FUNG|nr:XRN 5'-3' exonuclease N-terminus-domain-containing protein [Jimgerdemannia flammicorona]